MPTWENAPLVWTVNDKTPRALIYASSVSPIKAFLLGQKYQKKLEEKLKAVLAATEAVKSEATLCLHEVNAEGLVRTIANEDQSITDPSRSLTAADMNPQDVRTTRKLRYKTGSQIRSSTKSSRVWMRKSIT